jgi:hypothetical protein
MTALGLLSISPEVASAGRRSQRRNDNQGRNSDEAESNPDGGSEKTAKEQEPDAKNASTAGVEGEDTSENSGKSGKHERNQQQTAGDERVDQNGRDAGKSRDNSSRRNDDSNSSSSETSGADGESHRGGRQDREFAQQADPALDDSPREANPNVFIDDVPETTIADLVVEANDDVLASVSSRGGFAFARSGDVIAMTGPDGATIVQTGDVSTGTRGTDPVEPPDDGGNNDPVFLS